MNKIVLVSIGPWHVHLSLVAKVCKWPPRKTGSEVTHEMDTWVKTRKKEVLSVESLKCQEFLQTSLMCEPIWLLPKE